jgi:phage/plasmid-associated DNA primase
MSNLDIYEQSGFKFFLCKADKKPDTPGFLAEGDARCWNEKEKKYKTNYDWKQPENHISKEQADEYQRIGRMVGAWIPEDIIVIDLDRVKKLDNKGNPTDEYIKDGLAEMKAIKEKYNINYSITDNTYLVKTPRGGFHIFYTTSENNQFGQKNGIVEGVDIKTNKGYVIASGSPGYSTIYDNEIMSLPFELEQFLIDYSKRKEPAPEKETKTTIVRPPAKVLKSILSKLNVETFGNNDDWFRFTASAIKTFGDETEIIDMLEEFSRQDPKYKDDRTLRNRLESYDQITDIKAGTFIHYLKKSEISEYLINKVNMTNDAKTVLVIAENSEIELPFNDIDYNMIAETPAAQEFFETQGNTCAALMLEMALSGKVIYEDGSNEVFYFDGSRWVYFTNMYDIIYTILFRVIKILFNKSVRDNDEVKLLRKCVRQINFTNWKSMTWKEFCSKPSIYRKEVKWDSPKIKESITLIDGVIDFSDHNFNTRNGYFDEYRKSYFDYTIKEVMEAEEPAIFINFLNDLFPDRSTLETAKYCISMLISGNASNKYFFLWSGIQDNGKTTLVETLDSILGKDKSHKFPSELLIKNNSGRSNRETFRSELAQFQGKYFCYAIEVEKDAKFSQNTLKELTGEDSISARAMRKDAIEFEATWQIVYCVNDLPQFDGTDGAFIDRLMVLPFKMFFWKDETKLDYAKKRGISTKYIKKAKKGSKFKSSLYSEKAGIIKWMIEKYNYLNTELDGSIPESNESLIYKHKYVSENNDIGLFMEQMCIIDYDKTEDWSIKADDLLKEYHDFMGTEKRGRKSFIADIKKQCVIIDNVQKWFEEFEGANIIKKRHVVLTNIKLKTEKEHNEEHLKETREAAIDVDLENVLS